jgi:hypothetical protein
MKPKWTMRFRFLSSHTIMQDDQQIGFSVEKIPVILAAKSSGVKLKDTNDFLILAKGLNSEEEALKLGSKVRNALKMTAVFSGVGIDVGKDKPTSSFSKTVKDEALKSSGVAMYDDVHGLSVYPEDPPPGIMAVNAKGSVGFSSEKFIASFEKAFSSDFSIPDELELAADLYCASCMERSSLAKLILALSAIEYIAEQPERPEGEIRLLNMAYDMVKNSDASRESKESVMAAFDNIRRISKGRAGRNLIKKLLPDDFDEFCALSDYRGRVAHPSKAEDRAELPDMAFRAQRLTGRLIEKIIAG